MTKFLLHGGFTRRENELNRSFYEEFARDIPDGGTILLVYFASRSDDTADVFAEQSKWIREQSHGKTFHFVHATKEGFLEQLKQADAVYFHGGSTNKLLAVLRTYPDFAPLVQGKSVAGSSAGAYALAMYGTSHSEAAMREGLGLVPLRVICHYGSPDLPPSDAAVEILKHTAEDLELVTLRDCEWKMFKQ
ncbi:MAG TPA: Type 1 glutamine amidotransferase-like domain-containing protein [Candidatus Paceibacterota bacterium]